MRIQKWNVCCQQTQSREISCIIVFEWPYCCNVPRHMRQIARNFGYEELLEGKPQAEAFGMGMEEANGKWMDFMASYVG